MNLIRYFLVTILVVSFSYLSVGAAVADRTPLPDPELPGIYQRILTLPDAALHRAPDGPVVGQPTVFSVMYVYDRREAGGETWLEVGARASGDSDGYIRQNLTEAWKHMLVVRFGPRGARSRVLFFRDRATLTDLAKSLKSKGIVEGLQESVAEGRPDSDILIAAEPATAVKYEDQPYLFPVLDFLEVRIGGREFSTLVNVAGHTLQPGDGNANFDDSGSGVLQPELQDFRFAVVFVVDTTRSMKPYLNQIYSVVTETYQAFQEAGQIENTSFGLVAFRDNLTPNPRIGYVTDIILPLNPYASGDADKILTSIGKVDISPVSTQGWNEDAFAGLRVAMNELAWEEFDARLVVLVTDAGARAGNDPMAAYPGTDATSLVQFAADRRIALFPIHLHTDEAQKAGNVISAERQYRALAQTGDSNVDKYIGLPAVPIDLFTSAIQEVTQPIVSAGIGAAQGRSAKALVKLGPNGLPVSVADKVINEIFRAQLEFLGARQGTAAPQFYRAWAADRDLLNPKRQSLEVAVFLTRNQLNALGQSMGQILDAAEEGRSSGAQFFDKLQDLATRTSYDPNRPAWTKEQTVREAGLLPAYLEKLPYHSEALTLTQDIWTSLGRTGQQELLENLNYKLTAYQDINSFDSWIDLGAATRALEVYPVPLSLLP